jgi:hypothetical protein
VALNRTVARGRSFLLNRTVARGRSFLQLLAEGADGRATAQSLVQLVTRSQQSRVALDVLLGDKKPSSVDSSELGRSSFREDA